MLPRVIEEGATFDHSEIVTSPAEDQRSRHGTCPLCVAHAYVRCTPPLGVRQRGYRLPRFGGRHRAGRVRQLMDIPEPAGRARQLGTPTAPFRSVLRRGHGFDLLMGADRQLDLADGE